MKFVFLGSGPTKSVKGRGRNRRRNSSALILDKVNILIDVTPEFTEQMKKFAPNLKKIDYLLITHGHNDCIGGWYQLRKWLKKHNQDKINVILERKTLNRIKDDFKDTSFAKFIFVKPGDTIRIKQLTIKPFRVTHAEAFPTGKKFPCLGYRINNLVYAEDMEDIPKESRKYFRNASVMILDAAMWFGKHIRGHMNVEEALKFAKQFNPRYLILTQAGHTYPSYAIAEKKIKNYAKKLKIKSKVRLSYDGMKINISRKFRRLQIMAKVPGEEGETRGEAASNFWKNNWWKCFPKTGKGEFVYQHHWRGLTEEEAKWDEDKLLQTDRSVHGDLRFSKNDSLYGFTIFLGKVEDLRNGRDVFTLKEPDKLQGTWKLMQPRAWLDFEGVTKPGEIGATEKKYAKFFIIDKGKYEIGVWREHFFEFFLHGKKLKGRYLIVYAPVGGSRKWLIGRPNDQRPYTETHKKGDVIKELKKKKQRWLVWARPGCKPILYDVNKVKFPIAERMSGELQFSLISRQIGNKRFLELNLERENYCEVWRFEPQKAGEKLKLVLGSRVRKLSNAPIESLTFEGIIPKGKPGASRDYCAVIKILDKGTYRILEEEKGYLKIQLEGKKLDGIYSIKFDDAVDADKSKYRYIFDKGEDMSLINELLNQIEALSFQETRTEEKLFSNFKVVTELGDHLTPLKIKGIAITEGTWNGLFYPREELRKAARDLKGKPLMVDHSKSVKDLVGRVTDAWFNEAENAIEFEAEIIDENIAKKVVEGLITGVSVGVIVDRVKEGSNLVARNYEFTELSLVLVPACKDAKIVDIEKSYATKVF